MGSLVTSTPAKIIAVTEFPGRRAWSCSGGEVVELQENVILLRSTASTLADLDRHGTRHNVPGGQILGHRGIPLHEPLALAVDELSALSSAALGDEAAGLVDFSLVELHKLHVLIGKT